MDALLSVPQGVFKLTRLPRRAKELLQAWDAADVYLLEEIQQYLNRNESNKRLLIVNDSFGALAVALNQWHPQAWSDSWLSQTATRINFSTNHLPLQSLNLLASVTPLQGSFDYVLIKVPKTLALFEEQLIQLRPHLKQDSTIIVGAMLKALPNSVWSLLERLIGSTRTLLAQKKVRLIYASYNPDLPTPISPYPIKYLLEDSGYLLTNHANVFSRDSLDIGTRFFLNYLPVRPKARDIVDLGCGNGVVGLMAAKVNPAATVHFIDESFMAVASAEENFRQAFGASRNATFKITDGLTEFPLNSMDIVLCNPPLSKAR